MKKNKKRRIAFFTTILIVCTICIGITISMQMNLYYEKQVNDEDNITNEKLFEIDQELFRSKFINSFDNKLNLKSISADNIEKIDTSKEIVYANEIKESTEGKYDLTINIPYININNEIVEEYNNEIKSIFENKIEEIKKKSVKTIYTVDYIANVNNNILSLAIKATLKEGESSQRMILKTYNYNLGNNKEVKLEELISNKQLDKKEVKVKLKQEVEKQNNEALELQKLGYSAFVRNITEDMFNIEKINAYFVDNDEYIYILYPYGNNNLTTEMDIIVFN